MHERAAADLCERALAAWRQLAAHYDELEPALASGELDLREAVRRLHVMESAIAPLLRPLSELRTRSGLDTEVTRMLGAIDGLTASLVDRNATLLRIATDAREACAARLVNLARRRTTRAGYAAATVSAPLLSSTLA
jgi:hypothetical protein